MHISNDDAIIQCGTYLMLHKIYIARPLMNNYASRFVGTGGMANGTSGNLVRHEHPTSMYWLRATIVCSLDTMARLPLLLRHWQKSTKH